MTLEKLHAKMQEAEHKSLNIDGRRFNKRSHIRMNREIRDINRAQTKMATRNHFMRTNNRGNMFSKEEIEFANEEKKKFREESEIKLKKKEEDKKCSAKSKSVDSNDDA